MKTKDNKTNELYDFLVDIDKRDAETLITTTSLYTKSGYKGTCMMNLSRGGKYIIDREGDILSIKTKVGHTIISIKDGCRDAFMRNLLGFFKYSDVKKGDCYERLQSLVQ